MKLDPLTATASFVGKTNGFLTGPSAAPAGVVGLDYVKANAAALGLTANGVAALELSRDYVDILGTHHLSYVQKVNGVTVFGNGVKVNVAKDGRIINVTGSPVASLAGAPAATPGITRGPGRRSPRSRTSARPPRRAATTSRRRPDDELLVGRRDEARLLQDPQRAHARVPDAARERRLPHRRRCRLGQGPLPRQLQGQRQRPRLGQPPRGGRRRNAALVRRQRPGRLVELRRLQPPHRDGRRPLEQQRLGVQRHQRQQRRQRQRTDPERRHGQLQLRVHAVHQHHELAVLDGLSVLLELALPGRRVLLGYEPEAERHAGVLLRQHLPRPPAGRADRVHGGRGQLPARQLDGSGRGR